MPVFETGALDHSATSPSEGVLRHKGFPYTRMKYGTAIFHSHLSKGKSETCPRWSGIEIHGPDAFRKCKKRNDLAVGTIAFFCLGAKKIV